MTRAKNGLRRRECTAGAWRKTAATRERDVSTAIPSADFSSLSLIIAVPFSITPSSSSPCLRLFALNAHSSEDGQNKIMVCSFRRRGESFPPLVPDKTTTTRSEWDFLFHEREVLHHVSSSFKLNRFWLMQKTVYFVLCCRLRINFNRKVSLGARS